MSFATTFDAQPVDARRRALVFASIGAHVALGIGLFGYSLLHIEEIAPPQVSLTFFAAPPPPPPPPPPAGHKAKTTPKIEPKIIVDPKLVMPTEKKEEPKKEDPGEQGGVEGGVQGGVAGGVVGGVVGGTLGGTGAAPKMVASFALAAQQLQHTDPLLPDWFMNSHAKQQVMGKYKVCLREDGHVSDVTTITAIGGVDEAVLQQIKDKWLYKPQPVPVCMISVLKFKIN